MIELARGPSVAGIVRDDIGRPVSDFRVLIADREPDLLDAGSGGAIVEEYSSPDGAFRVGGLEDGLYDIFIQASHHRPSPIESVRAPNEAPRSFVVERLCPVMVTVVDDSAEQVGHAQVRWRVKVARKAEREQGYVPSGFSKLEVADFPATVEFESGEYELVASAQGFASNELVEIDVKPGEARTATIALRTACSIDGRLVMTDDVANRRILLWGDGLGPQMALVDAEGVFGFEDIGPGHYRLEVLAVGADLAVWEEEVTVLPGESRHVVIDVSGDLRGRLSGLVTVEGLPLARGQIRVFSQYNEPPLVMTLGDDGGYGFDIEVPGAYELVVSDPGGLEANRVRLDVPICDAHKHDIDIRTNRLIGRVTLHDESPAKGLCVALRGRASGVLIASMFTDSDGRYSCNFLPAGEFLVRIGNWPLGAHVGPMPISEKPFGSLVFPIALLRTDFSPASLSVETVLPLAGAISGCVRDDMGRPVQGAIVEVVDQYGSLEGGATGASDASGRFVLGGLGPAPYAVRAIGHHSACVWQDVTVLEGQQAWVNIFLH
ncbi:MAG: carboxypeptidase regulatory-like domain-containing protein [bacterium]|nr:carboxypeptidase regulatory-like domain-containing protein [bacterium]